jgi:opacity protein-like surface antigen
MQKAFHISTDRHAWLTGLLLTCFSVSPAWSGEPYMGIGFGQASYAEAGVVKDSCAAFGYDCPVDDTDVAIKLFGGYRFGQYVGIEGGVVTLGEASTEVPEVIRLDAAVKGATLSVVPRIPLGDKLSVYGKAGLFAWYTRLKAESEALGESASADGVGISPTYGAGVALHVSEQTSVRLEWERYNVDDEVELRNSKITLDNDIDAISASFEISFK